MSCLPFIFCQTYVVCGSASRLRSFSRWQFQCAALLLVSKILIGSSIKDGVFSVLQRRVHPANPELQHVGFRRLCYLRCDWLHGAWDRFHYWGDRHARYVATCHAQKVDTFSSCHADVCLAPRLHRVRKALLYVCVTCNKRKQWLLSSVCTQSAATAAEVTNGKFSNFRPALLSCDNRLQCLRVKCV